MSEKGEMESNTVWFPVGGYWPFSHQPCVLIVDSFAVQMSNQANLLGRRIVFCKVICVFPRGNLHKRGQSRKGVFRASLPQPSLSLPAKDKQDGHYLCLDPCVSVSPPQGFTGPATVLQNRHEQI